MIYSSKSVRDTTKIAKNLAQKIVKMKDLKHALVLAFEGELGAGKTAFIKSFGRALGVKAHITSPTFVILKNYKLKIKNYNSLVHIDAYRLKDFRDLIPLGIKDIFANQENIVLIEWAERVRPILPKKHIKIHIDHIDSVTRKIEIV